MSSSRPLSPRALTLTPVLTHCPACRHVFWSAYDNKRTVTTLEGVLRLRLRVRRCPNPGCSRFHLPYRPEVESHFALPHHKFGLDILAVVGRLRCAQQRSAAEVHQELTRRGVALAPRTIANLLKRYDELRALTTADAHRLARLLRGQDCVVLAVDGVVPEPGHDVFWVLRDCLSGEVMLARSLPLATAADLAALLTEVRNALPAPIVEVVSDEQETIRSAVAKALPGLPHRPWR